MGKKNIIKNQLLEIDELLKLSDFDKKNRFINEIVDSWKGEISEINACKLNCWEERARNEDTANQKLKSLRNKLESFSDEINISVQKFTPENEIHINIEQNVNQTFSQNIRQIDERILDANSKKVLEELFNELSNEKSKEIKKKKILDITKFLVSKGADALISLLPYLVSQIK